MNFMVVWHYAYRYELLQQQRISGQSLYGLYKEAVDAQFVVYLILHILKRYDNLVIIITCGTLKIRG